MGEEKTKAKSVKQELYESRARIIPRAVKGMFANLRILSVLVLMGIYYITPWINWGDRQIILYDMPARKFYFFDLVIWPQDFFYLTLLLVIAAFGLFFFTTLAGRLWCGYACPQTVWTEISMFFEKITLGNRQKQLKLAKMPWNAEKITRVLASYTTWIVFSLWTGFTFVGWFSPIRELFHSLITFNLSTTELFWILFYAFATWGMAGWLREQVCFYMCPYARFQSVMFDSDTLIVSYDYNRGEPRGRLAKGKIDKDNGSCIDCDICVQACPTGIDIRDGLQYECIACSACIDACDEVMEKIGQPKGLIRYTTEKALEGKKTDIVRARSVAYGVVFMLSVIVFFFAISGRIALELNIIRDRGALYTEDNEGMIQNTYNIKIMNMDAKPHVFALSVNPGSLQGLKIATDFENQEVASGEVVEIPLVLSVSPEVIKKRSNKIEFTLKASDGSSLEITEPARFLGPVFR